MTAEITVMNKEAVVLAADSAVTFGRAYLTKVSVSADKIFQLGMDSPVGIMMYGNALFMGLPWETVIKSYRANRRGQKFNSIEEYGKDFIKYLSNNNLEFDSDSEERYVEEFVASIFGQIQHRIDTLVERFVNRHGVEITKSMLKKLMLDVIDDYYKQSKKRGKEIVPAALGRKLVKEHSGRIDGIATGMFRESGLAKILNLNILTKAVKKKLKEAIANTFWKSIRVDIQSGLVIAGFGEKEYTPRIKMILIEGKISGKLKYIEERVNMVRGTSYGNIGAYAQREIAVRFMEGVDNLYREHEDEYIRNMCIGYAEEVVNQLTGYSAQQKSALKRQLIRYGNSIRREFNKNMERFIFGEFVRPILRTVGFLPKVELATLAEALVHLTSVKRKVSLEEETVAGPIDVAIISKSDGFVWIKRKHYFEAELNPQFFVRYRKEGKND